MKNWMQWILVFFLLAVGPYSLAGESKTCPETLAFKKIPLAGGAAIDLCQTYFGKVVVIVNTASKCGFTHQYEGLETLYRKYQQQGLVILGFPSNDFGEQEPGTGKDIQEFCRLTYGVQFPMFEKTHAARGNADPLFQKLGALAGEFPSWNFHKYIIDREGKLAGSFKSQTDPQDAAIVNMIESLL